jgi:rhamnosyltransferase
MRDDYKNKTLILISTFNGEKYLECLLDSVVGQVNCEFDILVRDDGSSDSTPEILERYQSEGKLKWYAGNNVGAANSFWNLITEAPEYGYYAFCDQDDYWEPDKLERAIERIKALPNTNPILYYGCPQIVDEELNTVSGYKSIKLFVDSFEGSLITSNAYGCTMVFNNSLAEIIKGKRVLGIYEHDVWLHKLCLLFGGTLVYDENVHIKYRQHRNNTVGITKKGWQSITRHAQSFARKNCIRSKTIEMLYENYQEKMTDDQKEICNQIIRYKENLHNKIRIICNRKIRTKSFKRNILFKMAILTNTY